MRKTSYLQEIVSVGRNLERPGGRTAPCHAPPLRVLSVLWNKCRDGHYNLGSITA